MRIGLEYANVDQNHVVFCWLINTTIISIAAITPTKLRKKVGPKKVPPSIDPITTRKKVTITASLNLKKLMQPMSHEVC